MSKPAVVVLVFGGDREPPTYTYNITIDDWMLDPLRATNEQGGLVKLIADGLVGECREDSEDDPQWASEAAYGRLVDIENYGLLDVIVTDGDRIWGFGGGDNWDISKVLAGALAKAFPWADGEYYGDNHVRRDEVLRAYEEVLSATGGAHDQDPS